MIQDARISRFLGNAGDSGKSTILCPPRRLGILHGAWLDHAIDFLRHINNSASIIVKFSSDVRNGVILLKDIVALRA